MSENVWQCPTMRRWHVVVVTKGGSGMLPGCRQILRNYVQLGAKVTLADTANSAEMSGWCASAGVRYMHIGGDFSWPTCANAAAAAGLDREFVLFLHDDTVPPEGTEMFLRFTRVLRQPDVGLVVPKIRGDAANPSQQIGDTDTDLMSYDTTEFISGAAFAIKRGLFLELGAFDEDFTGYDWWQIDLQARVADHGLATRVVPAIVVEHKGQGTVPIESIGELMRTNLEAFGRKHGGDVEYDRRPRRVRIFPKVRDSVTLCLIVDGADALLTAERSVLDEKSDEWSEIAVVDTSPLEANALIVYGWLDAHGLPVRYAPATDDPIAQIVNLAGCRTLDIVDLRGGAVAPMAVREARLRCGGDYEIPSHLDTLHIAMVRHMGFGDMLMATGAIHEFRRRYPQIRTIVHGWHGVAVFEGNPDVDSIVRYAGTNLDRPPAVAVDISQGTGGEGSAHIMAWSLGLEPLGLDLRPRYRIRQAEHDAAVARLESAANIQGAPWVIGVQLHGGWLSKQWAHTPELVQALVDRGAIVVLFGADPDRVPVINEHPQVVRVVDVPLREAIAMVGILDVMVGFDSGMTWAALAVGTPSVSLWGPLNPQGYVLDVCRDRLPNIATIRVRTPKMCSSERGRDCRESHGGSRCPFRDGKPGGDCYDEISVAAVLEHIHDMPTWGVPLAQRYHADQHL